MASTAEYLEYVLDLLRDVPDISHRKMMGEYVLYADGKVFGGIYDDRFLVKDTPASRAMFSTYEIPYEGGSPMLLVDIEDGDDFFAFKYRHHNLAAAFAAAGYMSWELLHVGD